MKELSIEEKAKAYDEAVEKAKERYNEEYASTLERLTLAYVFPELTEYEDKRIRKEITELVMQPTWKTEKEFHRRKELCAWLEKQGEQKPTDKVEPKFKDGDYIVYRDYVWKVFNVSLEKYYELLKINNEISTRSIEDVDNNAHLWTIQDAKDGDVLASKDGDEILIFRNLDSNTSFSSYYNIKGKGEIGWSNRSFIPATKEQRDQLEKAMTDAGYTFDFEKKELKKIEQKPAESNDIKGILLVHDEILNSLLERYKTSTTFKTLIVNLKNWWNNTRIHLLSFNIEQNPSWSEEDENHIQHISDFIMRNRVGDTDAIYHLEQDVKWLKSLKEKFTWKPSDLQIKALEYYTKGGYVDKEGIFGSELVKLLEELKKL